MRDRLLPINENEPTPDTDKEAGDSRRCRCGPRVLLCAVPGAALVWLLVWLSDGGGDDYGFCTATQRSRPNNAMPLQPSRTVPKSCPKNPSSGCHGSQPDDPECCVGAACCRCSTDSSSYNPTPKLFTDFNNFSFDLHVVCATEKAGGLLGFPVRPNKVTGNEGNMRLVGVALPEGTPPAGGWPVVVFFAGSDNERVLKTVLEPDKYCNIENKGCGMNVTAPMLTQCHEPDGDPNMPPGFHLYPTYKPDGSTAWIDYAWRHLDFVSNYQAQRTMRRLLLSGFAVVHPQTWGVAGWYSYDSNPAGFWYDSRFPEGEQGIWPGPDKVFLDSLYDDIADGRFGPLNHTHQHVFGFSSGGFWVSRMIAENSGLMKTSTGRPWPEIASAVMLCGGSFQTYNDHGEPIPQEGLPDEFFWQHNGSYRLNTTRRHPPSVLAQPQGDDFVPPTVSENYVRALKAANISAKYVTVPTTEMIAPGLSGLNTTWKHMFFAAMVDPAVELFCNAAGKDAAACLSCGDLAPC